MDRRAFLQLLALAGAGCSRAPKPVTPSPSPSKVAVSATPAAMSRGEERLLARAVIKRYVNGVFEDPEVGVWHLWSNGKAEQKSVFSGQEKGSVIAGLPGQNVFFKQTKETGELICYRVDEKDQVAEVYRAKRPEKTFGSVPFPGPEPMLISGKYGKEEAVLSVFGKEGLSQTIGLGIEGEPKKVIVDGDWVSALVERGFRDTKEVDLVLLELKNGKAPSKRFQTSLTELTRGGYGLGARVYAGPEGLWVSAGVMNSVKDGDFISLFKEVDGKLELVQKLEAGFRPPPMRFLADGRLGIVQDNSGDVFTFVRSDADWKPAGKMELAALGDYITLGPEQDMFFSKNNPGDILWVGLSQDGTLNGPHYFPELVWQKEGRDPARIQHNVVGIVE